MVSAELSDLSLLKETSGWNGAGKDSAWCRRFKHGIFHVYCCKRSRSVAEFVLGPLKEVQLRQSHLSSVHWPRQFSQTFSSWKYLSSTVWECSNTPGQRIVNNVMSCIQWSQKNYDNSLGIWKFVCVLLVYYCKVWEYELILQLLFEFWIFAFVFFSSSFSALRSHLWSWNNAASVPSWYFISLLMEIPWNTSRMILAS